MFKKTQMSKSVIFILFLLLAVSCDRLGEKKSVYGNGNDTLIKRSSEDYVAISLSGFFNVELVDGTEGDLTLKGEENLLKHIITEVKDGELYLGIEQDYILEPSSNEHAIQVTVPVQQINAITLTGSGDIISKKTLQSESFMTTLTGAGNITVDLEVDSLSARLTGVGILNFSGKAKSFDASASGTCKINAYNLEADNVELSLSGIGTLKVKARKKLKATITGMGYIYYLGKPEELDLFSPGLGKFIEE